jgi:hypothetical protein
MKRIVVLLVGFLAVAAVIGLGATRGGLGGDDGGGESAGVTGGGAAIAPMEVGGDAAARGMAASEEAATDPSVSQLGALPEIGTAVVKTADLSISVDRDGFAEAFDAATLVAARYGGFVQSSSMGGTRVRSGHLVLRIPADRFGEAMSDLRALGTVEGEQLSGEDVTAQFVDLEARLRAWQSQEAVLLDLMGQATSIEATIRVQGELQEVQVRIEELRGQLRLLEDRTDLATIQVAISEPGAPVAVAESDETRPSMGEAWERALDGFVGVFYVTVVGLGYLVPITVLLAIGWFGYRRASRPRAATPAS